VRPGVKPLYPHKQVETQTEQFGTKKSGFFHGGSRLKKGLKRLQKGVQQTENRASTFVPEVDEK